VSTPTPGAVEVVLYRPRPGVTDEHILEASDALQADVERFPGYIRRRLMKTGDGLWVDTVDWRSLEQAEAAAAAISERPSAARFMGLVEESTIQMLHPLPIRVYGPATRDGSEESPTMAGPGAGE
jgi:hypothetical protein